MKFSSYILFILFNNFVNVKPKEGRLKRDTEKSTNDEIVEDAVKVNLKLILFSY